MTSVSRRGLGRAGRVILQGWGIVFTIASPWLVMLIFALIGWSVAGRAGAILGGTGGVFWVIAFLAAIAAIVRGSDR